MEKTTEFDLIKGLKERNGKTLKYIYKNYFPAIKNLVDESGGTEDDAEDLFQEGIVHTYNQLLDNEFVLTCSLFTYIYEVCKRMWQRQQWKKNRVAKASFEISLSNAGNHTPSNYDFFPENIEYLKDALIQKHFLTLAEDCQKILQMFYNDNSYEEIKEIMGYASEEYARVRKYLCKELLKKKILTDPLYINF